MVLVEIEKTAVIKAAMVFRPPVWHFPVYETGSFFPWFKDGGLGRGIVRVGSLCADNIYYTKAKNIQDPMELGQKQFCQMENIVYVRPDKDNPLWLSYMPKYSITSGFTDGPAFAEDGVFYRSGLTFVPQISDSADSMDYGRMVFKGGTIDLINAKGEYDSVAEYFGNNIRVMAPIDGEIKGLCEYYIKNVKIKETKTTFVCGDRREKLRQKVPAGRFTLEEYPDLKPELEGEIKQDVYGRCEWVKCTCIDEMNIYADEKNTKLKQYRTFYAARKIAELSLKDTRPEMNNKILDNRVWIKQTQPETGEVWTPCHIDEGHSDLKNGIFALEIEHCMPPTYKPAEGEIDEDGEILTEEGWAKDEMPSVYEVRACGTFWAPDNELEARPLDVIKELFRHYCGIPYDQYWFNITEIEKEIGGLAPVGIVYDQEFPIFEAIEKLQNSSNWGFRFTTDYDKFTAKMDWNERKPLDKKIKITDIVDIGKAEIDTRLENYITVVDVAYERDYFRETAKHCEGTTNRDALLYVHGIDKIYEPETYLIEEKYAKQKAEDIEKFYSRPRAMINNLELINWPGLRVYDIVDIDLRIPLERKAILKHTAVLFDAPLREIVAFGDWPSERVIVDFEGEDKDKDETQKYRNFGGVLRCKVMSIKLNLETGTNTVSLLEVGYDR